VAQQYVEAVVNATSVARGGGTKNFVNVFHYRRTTIVNPVSKTNFFTGFNNNIVAAMVAALNEDWTGVNVMVRYYDDALDAYLPFTITSVGAITGQRAPDYVAATIQLKTAVRGRFARGSKHFGPITESDTTGDVLTAPSIALFSALGTAMVTPFTDSDGNIWQMQIRSSKAPAQYKVNPVTIVANDVVSMVLNHSLGTMRRRKVKTVI